jgi:hypothetical protein
VLERWLGAPAVLRHNLESNYAEIKFPAKDEWHPTLDGTNCPLGESSNSLRRLVLHKVL